MTLVPIKIDDDLQDENSKLRALISNNFGRRKNDPAKDRKALETYVSLRGYKQGGNGSNQYKQKDHNGLFAKATLDEIAKELNMSTTNLKRALRIERIYGISKGNNQHSSLPNNSVSSQDDLAKK